MTEPAMPDPNGRGRVWLKRSAPGAAEEIDRTLDRKGVTFEFSEDRALHFKSSSRNGLIKLGLHRCGVLLAFIQSHLVLNRHFAAAARGGPGIGEIDLTTTPEDRCGILLLDWVADLLIAEAKHGRDSVEAEAVRGCYPSMCQPMPEANVMLTLALGFCLHHELAHIVMRHRLMPGPINIVQERDADFWAANKVLQHVDGEDEKLWDLRAVSVCFALSITAVLDALKRPREPTTHPPALDRVFDALEPHVKDNFHQAWFVLLSILWIYAQQRGDLEPPELGDDNPPKQAAHQLIEQLKARSE